MADIDVSVIIPIKNISTEIDNIIREVSEKNNNINLEFIITDIGSDNKGMIASLDTINKYNLHGCVVKCGSENIGSALNFGISKAIGKYVTFLFPRRLYTDCLSDYFADAKDKNAEFVFGSLPLDSTKDMVIFNDISPTEILEGIILNKIPCDIASVLISTKILKERGIYFSEKLKIGYSEDFIYKVLLNSNTIVKSDTIMVRNTKLEPEKVALDTESTNLCFDKVDAMISLRDSIPLSHKDYKKIHRLFTGEKIPSTIFSCIDTLLKDNYTYKAIKQALKQRNYDELLTTNKYTSNALKRKIYTWKLTPGLYKYDR